MIANGANKVGAEAAEAALEEVYADPDAPKAPPPSLLAKCVYHVVATRVSPPPSPPPRPAPLSSIDHSNQLLLRSCMVLSLN